MSDFQERDADRLLRILDYCDRIDACVRRFGDNVESFMNDADYRDAIKMNLFQIGETVNISFGVISVQTIYRFLFLNTVFCLALCK